MSSSDIPERTKLLLWGKAAGRCEYEGCNTPLWRDQLTRAEFNTAYVAHIIADRPDGPRGDPVLSIKLRGDLANLMLLCDEHHRLIDRERAREHPVDRLLEMKRRHEDRIELATSLAESKKSHVLLYGANIGTHSSPVSWIRTTPAMLPQYYPAESHAIELGLKNSSLVDTEPEYWQLERGNLQRLFSERVIPRLTSGEISHLSVFGLAPQPLLVELGRLLSDIPAAQVYQLHREPPDWMWQESAPSIEYRILRPANPHAEKVALNLSLSATISPDRIVNVLGANTSIWTLTIDKPYNDFLRSRQQLSEFRMVFRPLLDEIKSAHGQNALLHIFPAVPVAIAVEIGRVWMPKADLPLRIFDQNRKTGGFGLAFDVAPLQ